MDSFVPYIQIIQIIISIALIAVILVQSKGAGGLGGIFGGDSTVYRTRRGVEKTLFNATVGLALAFFAMPYIEVGKSRRYADRRVGLSISMLFIAFMLVSNWMGSPEFRVLSSPEQEVSQELIPQEGHSVILAVPYDDLEFGTYQPGQEVSNNTELTRALEEFEESMNRHSCNVNGSAYDDDCDIRTLDDGSKQYGNNFSSSAMPDPTAVLIIEPAQHNVKRVILRFEAADPEDLDNLIVDFDRIAFRHIDSGYEEQ